MNHTKREAGREAARAAGIPLTGDYHAVIDSENADALEEIARAIGYRAPKNANGSTARYFFYYLKRQSNE